MHGYIQTSDIMKKIISTSILTFMMLIISAYAQQQIFLIDFTITKDDVIDIERFLKTEGTPVSNDFNSEYSAKMFSGDRLLYFTDFIVDFTIDEQLEDFSSEERLVNVTQIIEERTLDATYITLEFPADRTADKIVFYKNDAMLYTLNLKNYLPTPKYRNFLVIGIALAGVILIIGVIYFVKRRQTYDSLRSRYSTFKRI